FDAAPGVLARDINDLHEGVEWASAYLAQNAGGDRSRPARAHISVGDGTARFCCLTAGPSFDIVTSNTAWAAPQAAAPDTWTAEDQRTELAGPRGRHTWAARLPGKTLH